MDSIEENSVSEKANDCQNESNISEHSEREKESRGSDFFDCTDGLESQKNEAFEVAIQ